MATVGGPGGGPPRRCGSAGGGGAENALLIGAGMNGTPTGSTSERFVGSIDELVLYDRALPPEEVAALAAGTQPALSP